MDVERARKRLQGCYITVPSMFRDLNSLAVWMAYSTFFARLGGEAIADHYGKLFARSG